LGSDGIENYALKNFGECCLALRERGSSAVRACAILFRIEVALSLLQELGKLCGISGVKITAGFTRLFPLYRNIGKDNLFADGFGFLDRSRAAP
jgi:hypothetical protein